MLDRNENQRSGEHNDPWRDMCMAQLAAIFKKLDDLSKTLNDKATQDALGMAALHTRVTLLETANVAREKVEAENRDRGRYTTGTLIAAVVAVVEIIHYFQR